MKKLNSLWFIFILTFSSLLSACSSPVGDFGRIDTQHTDFLTKTHWMPVALADKSSILNPLNFSEAEQQLRLTAHFLKQNNYNATKLNPIEEIAALRYFDQKGVGSIQIRHETISKHIDEILLVMPDFLNHAHVVLGQNDEREIRYNKIKTENYIAAIAARRNENLSLIHSVATRLDNLHRAYIFVVNHGNIVEPNLSDAALRSALQKLKTKIHQIQTMGF